MAIISRITFGSFNILLHGGSISQAINAAATGAVAGAISGGIAGQYGNTWNAQRVGASALGSGISAELQGGKFRDGFKAGIISASLRHLYNNTVGYDIDGRAGGEGAAPIKDRMGDPLKGYNNIGSQTNPDSWTYEGKLFSKVLNISPLGINAISSLHDKFQLGLDALTNSTDGWARTIFNVPGMIPAAAITYGGMSDSYGINSQLAIDRIRR